jgi:hypothetical protein
VNFYLTAGISNANRYFGLLGSVSGTDPGTPLPGGLATLPINWDWFTDLMINLGVSGHPHFPLFGNLDGDGNAQATLTLPGMLLHPEDITMSFAYCLEGPPWDFASNAVDIVHLGYTPPEAYFYDDGSTENLLGYAQGGEMCWMHWYYGAPWGVTISTIEVAWGSAKFPGYGPGNGVPSTIFVWDDPDNDGDPHNGVLVAKKETVTSHYDEDYLVEIKLDVPVTVNGKFFIGCVLHHEPGQYVAPMDQSTFYQGQAWVIGEPGGVFDYNNLSNNSHYGEMGDLGYPAYFLLRAFSK